MAALLLKLGFVLICGVIYFCVPGFKLRHELETRPTRAVIAAIIGLLLAYLTLKPFFDSVYFENILSFFTTQNFLELAVFLGYAALTLIAAVLLLTAIRYVVKKINNPPMSTKPLARKASDGHEAVKCNSCNTVFECSTELLESADTRVRCGECLSIFDAKENLLSGRSDQVENPPAETYAKDTALDVVYSDFDLFAENCDLPEDAYFNQTVNTPDFDFDSVELGNDDIFSDKLFKHDVTIVPDSSTVNK